MYRAVFDTNIVRAAVWSSTGASWALLQSLPHPRVTLLLSHALYLEYQDVLTRAEHLPPGVSVGRMLAYLRRLSSRAQGQVINFRWRPWLRDPKDELVLELAMNGNATHLVTFNRRDFEGIESCFGIRVVTPAEFLALLLDNP